MYITKLTLDNLISSDVFLQNITVSVCQYIATHYVNTCVVNNILTLRNIYHKKQMSGMKLTSINQGSYFQLITMYVGSFPFAQFRLYNFNDLHVHNLIWLSFTTSQFRYFEKKY